MEKFRNFYSNLNIKISPGVKKISTIIGVLFFLLLIGFNISLKLSSDINKFASIYNPVFIIPADLATGLSAHYLMNDTDGINALDSTINQYNASGTYTPVPGKISGAFALNGSTDFISVPAATLSATSSYSIEMWFNPSNNIVSTTSEETLLRYSDNSSVNDVYLRFQSGVLHLQNNGGGNIISNSNSWAAGQWYHVVGTFDSSVGMKMYINNVLQNSTSSVTTRGGAPYSTKLYIGAHTNGIRFFGGLIDDVRIYNRALTANDVSTLYNTGIGTEDVCPGGMTGTGVSGDECVITNWTQLASIKDTLSLYYKLNNDLSSTTSDYSGLGDSWLSIGSGATPFSGNFDGSGHTIDDIRFYQGGDTNSLGLFKYIGASGIVKNVNLDNIDSYGVDYIGTLVAWNYGTVQNCSAAGTVSGTSGGGTHAGLVAVNYGTIDKSHAGVSVTGNHNGGLVGQNQGIISNSYATGMVGTPSGANGQAGGLVHGNYGTGSIINSYATGVVTGTLLVGGLVGQNSGSATIDNSYSTGFVTGSGIKGGLIGGFGGGTITNSFWDIDTSGQTTSFGGGIGKTNDEMKKLSTFSNAGWNITTTSNDLNNGYPYLAWQNNSSSSVWQFRPNIPPVVTNVSIIKTTPLIDNIYQGLSISNLNATDTEGDNITLSYDWYKNNVLSATTLNTNGLVAYYPLDHDTLDYIGGNDGKMVNGSAIFETGKVGEALRFNGSDYVSIPSSNSLNISGSVTLSAWIKANNLVAAAGIIAKQYSSTLYTWPYFTYALTLDWRAPSSTAIRFAIQKDTNYYDGEAYTDSGYISTSTWYHVVGTFDGSTRKVYINGVNIPLNGATTTTGAILTTNEPVLLGQDTIVGNPLPASFDGDLDEVMIFNRALSASEVQQLYLGGLNGGNQLLSFQSNVGDIWKVVVTGIDYLGSGNQTNSNDLIVSLQGSGRGNPPVVTHSACNSNNQCITVNGAGTNQCSINADCVSSTATTTATTTTATTTPPVIACTLDANCGISDYTEKPFCQDNNVYQSYINYSCNNASTTNSFCSSATSTKLKTTCLSNQICESGTCEDKNFHHSQCAGLSCVAVDGAGPDQCKTDTDCKPITREFCGDNICSASESCNSCPGDCGQCQITNPITNPTENPNENPTGPGNQNPTGNGSTSTSTATSTIMSFIEKINLKPLVENITVATENVKQAVVSPQGAVVTKTVSTAGIVAVAVASAGSFTFSFSDVFLIIFRLYGILLTAFGLKKIILPWGTVYDSVTKQPLDPAYVVLKDLNGKEIASAITDLDGRFGFLVEPGIYTIMAQKTNYTFPSQKLAGKENDELHKDLYFGENIEVKTSGEVIIKNLPLDPVNFDWNEFAKKDKNIMKFYSRWDVVKRKIYDWLFIAGLIVAVVACVFSPYPYNIAIIVLYLFLLVLRMFGVKPKTFGYIKEKETGFPLSFAIIRIILSGSDVMIASKSADKLGKYYCLVPAGKYYIKIEKKNNDGSYSLLYTSSEIDATHNGIINNTFSI